MNQQALLAWLLRIAGSFEMLAFLAMAMPRSWMEISHSWLGMGEMPDGAVIMFMIRQSSYVYGMHGVALWILASNIDRYRPLIIFNGIGFLLGAPIFFIIDYVSGMPWFWTVFDVVGCAGFGAAVLFLLRRSSPGNE
jgi:hypothetical protein